MKIGELCTEGDTRVQVEVTEKRKCRHLSFTVTFAAVAAVNGYMNIIGTSARALDQFLFALALIFII
jgi:hypothetical protein